MRLTVQRAALLEALAHVRGCVPQPRMCTHAPVLACFHLEARDGALVVTGSDAVTVGSRFTVDATVETLGATAVPAAEFASIVASLRDGEVTIRQDRFAEPVSLVTGRSRYQLDALDPDDFPRIDSFDIEGEVEIPARLLAEMAPLVDASISNDPSRPHMCGAFLHADVGVLTLVSTDGHRLTAATHALAKRSVVSAIVPPHALRELRKLADYATKADIGAVVSLDVSRGKLTARYGRVAFMAALPDEAFPPWRKVIPTQNAHRVRLAVADLVSALRALQTVSGRGKDDAPSVLFQFSPGTLRLLSRRIGANGSEELPVDLDAKARVASQTAYALDALASIAAVSDEVQIEFGGELDPITFRPAEDGPLEVVAVVMPIRWSD